jgi:hypothetical protein
MSLIDPNEALERVRRIGEQFDLPLVGEAMYENEGPGFGDAEYIIHELCHVLLLDPDTILEFLSDLKRGRDGLSAVSAAIRKIEETADPAWGELHELKTQACTVYVLHQLNLGGPDLNRTVAEIGLESRDEVLLPGLAKGPDESAPDYRARSYGHLLLTDSSVWEAAHAMLLLIGSFNTLLLINSLESEEVPSTKGDSHG